MKLLNHAIVRCLCALVAGMLLVAYPDQISVYFIIAIGALFFIPGLFTVISYYVNVRKGGSPFPLSGIGSALFGLWLMIMPGFFANIFMYVLGAVLVLAGIHQISRLVAVRNVATVSGIFYVMPTLVLIAGVLVLINPFVARTVPIVIIGISAVIYAVADFIRIVRFRKYLGQAESHVVDVSAEATPPDSKPATWNDSENIAASERSGEAATSEK